jgi:ribosomal subunit interface protein
MITPQITLRDIPSSPAITSHVERRVHKLELFFERVVDCHVVVEEPHRHSHKGKRFHVRINMHVPGKELVVSKNIEDAKEDVHAAIDDAFGDAERVLEDYARKTRDRLRA